MSQKVSKLLRWGARKLKLPTDKPIKEAFKKLKPQEKIYFLQVAKKERYE